MSAGKPEQEIRVVARALAATEIIAEHATDERRQRRLLERRIAEVRRMLGVALDDGRQVEDLFRQVAADMTEEEREEFLHGFLDSCGAVVRDAGHRLRDAFVASVRDGGQHARTR
jgi:hypothetical protein